MSKTPNGVQGAELLVDVFGCWPSFHDAEVLRFSLDREDSGDIPGPTVECVIHVFEMTREVNPAGYYVLKNHVLVTLRFLEVSQCELRYFNFQNVLANLDITDITNHQLVRVKYIVYFPSSFGMEATLQCYAVEVVRVQPCDSEGKMVEQ